MKEGWAGKSGKGQMNSRLQPLCQNWADQKQCLSQNVNSAVSGKMPNIEPGHL
jgi:hypothetical protein